ncbi:MAG: hypothetical protein ACK4VI_09015 [Alphaproteobacteria bacterium]
MKVNFKEFLKDSGISEPFYPGKRLVKSCHIPGEYKSHSVVFDWRNPDHIKIEVKAGLSGKELPLKTLKQYPVSFQSPTFVEIDVVNDNDDEDEEKSSSSGSSSSGGKGFKKKKLSDLNGLMSKAFADISEGRTPELGEVKKMVVMGMEVAKEAFEGVLKVFAQQINNSMIATTDILAKAGKFITRYTPPAFLAPKGDEDKPYKYDRVKNENIGMRGPSIG